MGTSNSNSILDPNSISNQLKSCKNRNQIFNGMYHLLIRFPKGCGKSKFKFSIEESSLGQIKYIHDGEIIRIENRINQQKKPKILTSLELIRNQKWEGQYSIDNQPIGIWKMIWKGEKQIFGGYYNQNSVKEGIWLEPCEGFWDLCQIYFVGVYFNGVRQGKWDYKQEEDIIGGGFYNQNGQKEGYWIELHENFNKKCQVTIQGEYKNNNKSGNWVYKYKQLSQKKHIIIQGGVYNQDGLKHKKWIELWKTFDDDQKVLFEGEYEFGKKHGIWNQIEIKSSKHYQIKGTGFYAENELENGYWQKMDKICRNYDHNIISFGTYVKGSKIGTWQTFIKDQLVGIGSYNQLGKKDGMWIHFPKRLQYEKISFTRKTKLITFVGEYQNGFKKGFWKIQEGNKIIGGGEYNDMGNKTGCWIDIWNFKMPFFVIQKGEYKQGIRIGKWETMQNKNGEQLQFKKIGEGSYDNQGMRHGKWISLHDNYNYNCQILDVGYYSHGMKQGRWDVKTINFYEHDVIITVPFWPKEQFYVIAGGNYKDGSKIGKWIEVDEFYHYKQQILYEGEYKNDLKYGKWEILEHHNNHITRIGDGYFDEEGQKNSKWIEVDQNCIQKLKLVVYQHGKKISIQQIEKRHLKQQCSFN